MLIALKEIAVCNLFPLTRKGNDLVANWSDGKSEWSFLVFIKQTSRRIGGIFLQIDGDAFFLFHEQKQQKEHRVRSGVNENDDDDENTLKEESCLEKNKDKYIIR
ncbi:Dihydrolipoyl dehydrogenase [Trichinella pseudospiralis]